MKSCFILVIPIYFIECFGLTETKHMSGGVFGWPDALKSQRNLWGNINIFNKIKLYKSEIDLPYLIDKQFFVKINVSLNEKIDKIMSKLQDQLDKRSNSTDKETDDNENTEDTEDRENNLLNIHSFSSIFQRKTMTTTTQPTYFEDNYDDENCDAYTNTKLFGKVLKKLSCEDNDLFLGQFLSYAIIFMPILIIGLLAFIFYIVFCFGCCCCCKARDRNCPGVVSIVFFGLITACMLIAIIFHIVGAVYLMNIINFFTSDQLYDEVEEMIDLVEPTMNNALSGINNEISTALNGISDGLFKVVDTLAPTLTDSVNSTISNITLYGEFYKNINATGSEKQNEVKVKENDYNGKCVTDKTNENCEIDYIQEYVNLSLVVETYNLVEEEMKKMNVASELSGLMEPISEMLNSTFSDFSDQINIGNMSISDLGSTFEDLKNIREKFDIYEYVQPWMITVAKVLLFVVSILMLLVLLLQVLAFWTKNCCSRCIVGACFPCCFCSCCQTIFGIITTMMGLFLLIINILYYQGDDIINKLVERVTNENKTIQFRPLNFSGLTHDLISEVIFDDLKIKNIYAIKSIVDAKLDSSLSDLIGFENLPIKDIAELLNNTFSNSKESTNPGLIVNPLREVLTTIMNEIVQNFNSTASFDFGQLRNGLILYKSQYYKDCGGEAKNCKNDFDGVNTSYESFISHMDVELKKIELVNAEVNKNTESSIQTINSTSTNLLEDLLITVGSTLHKAIMTVESVLEKVDAKFIVALFNIIRVRIFYQIMAYCMCVSISAHLFIIGMWAMTILLWIRRKGMAYQPMHSTTDDSYSISNSEDEDKTKKNTKRKHISEDENTSDENEEFQDKDIQKSDDDDENDTQKSSVKENESNSAISINNDIFVNDENSVSSGSIKVTESDNGISFNDSTANDNTENNNNYNVDRSSTDENSDDDGDDDDIQQSYVF